MTLLPKWRIAPHYVTTYESCANLITIVFFNARFLVTIRTVSLCLTILLRLHLTSFFVNCSAVYKPLVHDSDRDEPKPVHLHREIHSGIVPSSWTHEDDLGAGNGILLLR